MAEQECKKWTVILFHPDWHDQPSASDRVTRIWISGGESPEDAFESASYQAANYHMLDAADFDVVGVYEGHHMDLFQP